MPFLCRHQVTLQLDEPGTVWCRSLSNSWLILPICWFGWVLCDLVAVLRPDHELGRAKCFDLWWFQLAGSASQTACCLKLHNHQIRMNSSSWEENDTTASCFYETYIKGTAPAVKAWEVKSLFDRLLESLILDIYFFSLWDHILSTWVCLKSVLPML